MLDSIDNLRIEYLKPILTPALLLDHLPLSQQAIDFVKKSRTAAEAIISKQDSRLLVVVGPCSIHDIKAARHYADKLKHLAKELSEELLIVMRVYFEKPRTTIGWKGLINDPDLNGKNDINKGLHLARQLLIELADKQLPAATEFLDTIIPQYISDTITWGAIGARTTESQVHRELASGLSMPIGFKNATNGSLDIALDAVVSASYPHRFLSVSKSGAPVIAATKGNQATQIVLRGGADKPNYDKQSILATADALAKRQLKNGIMVDASHGNSRKDHLKQALVVEDLAQQISAGNHDIVGIMIESNLVAGKQKLTHPTQLVYGQSITDACMDWNVTEKLLQQLAIAVKQRQQMRAPCQQSAIA
ncbi:MAG: 3-deoxy-7-phosphoheptulonate synthase [Pseudomonadota bacterium]